VSAREPNRLVTIKKNPNYAKGVSRKYKRRPANLSQINIKTVVNLEASYQEVRANQADYTYDIPPTAPAELGREFGTTKGRFRVTGSNCVSYVAMNSGGTGSGAQLFNNNSNLRRAVNYVINRKAMVDLSGAYAGQPHDQYLPKGFPGYSTGRNRAGSDLNVVEELRHPRALPPADRYDTLVITERHDSSFSPKINRTFSEKEE